MPPATIPPNSGFTSLQIPFSQNDNPSIYFAHLQNIFKQLYHNHLQQKHSQQQLLLQKINTVMFDVYYEYQKLQKEYLDSSLNLKQMLTECSELVNDCKTDREQLVKVTEDRQAILEKLKESTNQSLEIVQEHEKMCQQLGKMREINILLTEKNNVLEEQIINVSTTNQGMQNIVKISKQFQKISTDNVTIQSDIADILKTTQMYGNASQPLQIMCLAFQQKPELRQDLWKQVAEKHKNKFQKITQTKQNFYNFSYIDALMLFSNAGAKKSSK